MEVYNTRNGDSQRFIMAYLLCPFAQARENRIGTNSIIDRSLGLASWFLRLRGRLLCLALRKERWGRQKQQRWLLRPKVSCPCSNSLSGTSVCHMSNMLAQEKPNMTEIIDQFYSWLIAPSCLSVSQALRDAYSCKPEDRGHPTPPQLRPPFQLSSTDAKFDRSRLTRTPLGLGFNGTCSLKF